MSDLSLPTSRYPRGWFTVGWSHELAAGEVKPLEYFGRKLVAWRGASGKAVVQDAFCLHLGAHRGVQGSVSGDNLVCPWHGWEWDGEGRNVSIPYSKERCKPHLQIRNYPVQEWCGAIMVWYDWAGGPPTHQLPEVPEAESPDYYLMHPFSSYCYRVKTHVQMPLENAADPAHIRYVHGSTEIPEIVEFWTKGDNLCAALRVMYGGGKKTTELTPDGPTYGTFRSIFAGIGVSVIRWELPVPSVQLALFTAVDDEYMTYHYCQTSRREPGDQGDTPSGRALSMIKTQQKVIPQDFFAWENMSYLGNPNFAVEEADAYPRLRRWARRFYPSDEDVRAGV